MKVKKEFLPTIVLCLLILSITTPAQTQDSSIMSYLDALEDQGKERVVVEFYGKIDTSLIEKYGGEVIRGFKTINGLLCEIPKNNIELLKQEDSVKEVVPDILIQIQSTDNRERDPGELATMLSLKKDYLRRIEEERDASMDEAEAQYEKAYQEYLANVNPYIRIYNILMSWYQKSNNVRLKEFLYRRILSRYKAIITSYNVVLKEAYQKYQDRINAIEEAYVKACSEDTWRKEINEIMVLSYTGPVTVRWNNLEAGLNSKAAWDRYDLSGEGVKIAFLDTGVNYTLPDLSDNYLGGVDFEDDDDDPITTNPDDYHGTEVVSLAIAKGISKVVGVSYNAGYYVVRVLDEFKKGFISNVVSGIEWASAEPHKADIISMSLAIKGDDPGWSYWGPKLENACNTAYEAGIVVVAGSGNDGYSYSLYPAAFENVISVGMHAINQVISIISNGGVDVVAPGVSVFVIDPLNDLYFDWGTSMATPHVSGLIALQIEYARKNNIDYNNGYHWEVMKHAAVDLGVSEPYQGKGKAWAAGTSQAFATVMSDVEKRTKTQTGYGEQSGYGTTQPSSSSNISDIPPRFTANSNSPSDLGSIDLMAGSWPVTYTFDYPGSFVWDGYPAFYTGTTAHQDTTLTNITDLLGNEAHTIENLNLTTTQKYQDTGEPLPGDSEEDFSDIEPVTIDQGLDIVINDDYYIPIETIIGTYITELDLEFKLEGINRLLKITDSEADVWCPPGPRPGPRIPPR